ncbi:unnamed protein product [Oreochromis niloticus]|nr:unnamed protein product [Mustela putorius furo]
MKGAKPSLQFSNPGLQSCKYATFVTDQKNITAESGQDVTLTCRAPNNNIKSVHWSRADLEDKYVLLYQDKQFVPDDQHPSFKNRVDLQDRQMKDGDVSLILKDVTINDTGTYECRVVQEIGQPMKLIGNIQLHVVPPGQPGGQEKERGKKEEVKKEEGKKEEGKKEEGKKEEGKKDGGKKHEVKKEEGKKEEGKKEEGKKDGGKKHEVKKEEGKKEEGKKEEGKKEEGKKDERKKHEVKTENCRKENKSPDFDLLDMKNITAKSGQDVTLTCRAPNNNIKSVHWSRADLTDEYVLFYQKRQFVPDSQHPSFKNRVDLQDRQMKDGDVSLILKDVNTADTGKYVCRVFIEETRSWKNISIISLHVVPPDQKTITAESGQNVTLTCRAPNNKITDVQWRRDDLKAGDVFLYWDGHFVPDSQHPSFKNRVDLQDRQMKDGDVSLILKDVTINDAGTYECHIFIRETGCWHLINSISLTVVDPPDCTETCHLQKFSDDSAVVGCISRDDETEYWAVVDSFVTWCEQNHLQLNVAKTKELIVDFRKTRKHLTPVSIQGKMLRIFYESVVSSAILYAVACWGSRLRVADANRLDKLIRKASNVVGMELDSIKVVSERRMLSKIKTMLDNSSHPLHDTLVSHRSTFSDRLRLQKSTTERHRKSFLPVAISLYNSST